MEVHLRRFVVRVRHAFYVLRQSQCHRTVNDAAVRLHRNTINRTTLLTFGGLT